MRRMIAVLLAALLLAGCGAKEEQKEDVSQVAVPKGAYIPESQIEKSTGGAVRMYHFPAGQSLMQTAGKLVLVNLKEPVELTLLSGDDLLVEDKVTLEKGMTLENARTISSGFAYYVPEINEAVILDGQLQEIKRVQLPGNVHGTPFFSDDGTQIYYAMGQNVYAFDVAMEISRLIRTHSGTDQRLIGCYLGGSVLCSTVTAESGEESTVYFSSQTGEALSYDVAIENLYSTKDAYLAVRRDGTVRQLICGTPEATPQNLLIDQNLSIAAAMELGGIVTHATVEGTLHLRFLDLDLGAETATVELQGIDAPAQFRADPVSGCLWFTATDTTSGQEVLLRWEISKTPSSGGASCLAPVYSAASPDKDGLALCQKRADTLNNTHGVTIRINDKATPNSGDYTLEREYQTVAINGCLDKLETVMTRFPKNFLYKSVQTRIRICVVRSITDGNGESLTAARYWSGGNAYIVITPQADIDQEFIKAMGYIVDSKVLGNSPMYDYWDELNPVDFTYGYVDSGLLEGDKRVFVDETAMLSTTEDRSRLFWQAMQPENGQMFQSEGMQKKLNYLCRAIRDGYGLEKKTDVYPWEQYLKESIAYKK